MARALRVFTAAGLRVARGGRRGEEEKEEEDEGERRRRACDAPPSFPRDRLFNLRASEQEGVGAVRNVSGRSQKRTERSRQLEGQLERAGRAGLSAGHIL